MGARTVPLLCRVGAVVAVAVAPLVAGCVPQPPGTPLGSVIIDLSEQQAYLLWPDGRLAARAPVSTGANGSTPVGRFTVYQKQEVGTSLSDRSVRMRYFTVFNGHVGMHALPYRGDPSNVLDTPLGERAVSRGCVRMTEGHARWVYESLPMGATVTVRP